MATVTLASLESLRSELVNSKYYLNLRSGYMAPVTLHCSYGDSGHAIKFYIFDGGDAVDLNGAVATVHGTRRDGASFGPFTCTVSGNEISFTLQSAMTAVEGSGIAEISISKNSATIGTCNFGILVENAVFPNGVAYDNDPSVYQDILSYVQTVASTVTNNVTADYINRIAAEASLRSSGDASNASSIATLTSRVDNLATLTEGSTTGDAELIDARVGFDGETYTSAGSAIRGQASNVQTSLTKGLTSLVSVTGTGNWTVGYLYDSSIGTNLKYAICTEDIVTIDADSAGVYTIDENYLLNASTYSGSSISRKDTFGIGGMGISNTITLVEGQTYKFMIRKLNSAGTGVDTSIVLSDTTPFRYGVTKKNKYSISYNEINDSQVNYDCRLYTAFGSATISNVVNANVTGVNGGILTTEFVPKASKVSVRFYTTFTTPNCIVKLAYYDTSWHYVSVGIPRPTSGQDTRAIVDLSPYTTATKFRFLFQTIEQSGSSSYTGTITLSYFFVYDYSELASQPYYDPDFEKMLVNIGSGKVYTCMKDGSGDFSSLVTAVQTLSEAKNATLYVGPGTWDIVSEFGTTYMESVTSDNTTWGLYLKNGIHIVGSSNSLITAKYTGSNSNTHEYFAAFNAGFGGFTLENLNIEDDNIRYTVHDDRGWSSDNDQYYNRYINCHMKHTNGMYSDCIGGGLGINGFIEIRDCYFEGDAGRTRLAYYHGNNKTGVTSAQCKLIVTGNYFANDGTFQMTKYGDSTKVSTAYVSNNSFGTAPEVNGNGANDNVAIVSWNNEVRS